MFAGATREVVFSRDDVIERVNRDFVPVALKAALVNNPPGGVEGAFLREIGRSKPAPQGICVANGAGKVLAWALSFDDTSSVAPFLDRVVERHRHFPAAATPVDAERFMRYPGAPLPAVADAGTELPAVAPHSGDEYCPATPPRQRGTVVARVRGRAVGDDGVLLTDCTSQERYIEDIFDIPPSMQEALARALAGADDGEESRAIELPRQLARHIVSHAYLGQLDVRPLDSPVPGNRGEARALEFRATRLGATGDDAVRFRITGRSDVTGSRPGGGGSFEHRVELEWDGLVEIADRRITSLALHAEGRERLVLGGRPFRGADGAGDIARLPAGRALDIDTRVRYGILGAPIPDSEAWSGDGPAPPFPGAGGQPGAGPGPDSRQRVGRLMGRLAREITRLIADGRTDEATRIVERAIREARELRQDRR